MKNLKVYFTGFWPGFNPSDNYIVDILKKRYTVEIDAIAPDYLFYSVFPADIFRYDCIRIFYTGENLVPDFNLCDYGIGFAYIDFEDRYVRFPQYMFKGYLHNATDNYEIDFIRALKKHERATTDCCKRKFCNYVYSNSAGETFREVLFDKLSEYKKIDSGGKHKNNIGYCIGDKYEFQTGYKFSIAVENSSTSGYTTEKILQAFSAGTIPIYWGNPRIGEEFNQKAFVNCHQFQNIEDAIAYIKEIDMDDEKYLQMLTESAFVRQADTFEEELTSFLYHIFDQDKQSSFRRNRVYWGERYERKEKIGQKFYLFLRKFLNLRNVILHK